MALVSPRVRPARRAPGGAVPIPAAKALPARRVGGRGVARGCTQVCLGVEGQGACYPGAPWSPAAGATINRPQPDRRTAAPPDQSQP